MKKVNIEFSHIYSNEEWGSDQIKSLKSLKETIRSLNKDEYVTGILIDDYRSKENNLNLIELNNKITESNVRLDFIVYESKLLPLAEILISRFSSSRLINEKFDKSSRSVTFLINSKNEKIALKEINEKQEVKYTCAILTAVWLLCRLGYLIFPNDSVIQLTDRPIVTESILSILPEKYKTNEDRALAILAQTKYSEALAKIRYLFIKGDNSNEVV